jgi:hypothetical protein
VLVLVGVENVEIGASTAMPEKRCEYFDQDQKKTARKKEGKKDSEKKGKRKTKARKGKKKQKNGNATHTKRFWRRGDLTLPQFLFFLSFLLAVGKNITQRSPSKPRHIYYIAPLPSLSFLVCTHTKILPPLPLPHCHM